MNKAKMMMPEKIDKDEEEAKLRMHEEDGEEGREKASAGANLKKDDDDDKEGGEKATTGEGEVDEEGFREVEGLGYVRFVEEMMMDEEGGLWEKIDDGKFVCHEGVKVQPWLAWALENWKGFDPSDEDDVEGARIWCEMTGAHLD